MSINYQCDGTLAEIVLDRPEKLNALNREDVRKFGEFARQAEHDNARAVLLRAEGRAFCVGRDLDSFAEGEDVAATLRDFNLVIRAWHELPIPTVVAVQGHCLGLGAGLALAGDLVVAGQSARFGSPFARLGAIADCGFHWHVTTRLGSQVGKDLLLTGRLLTGAEAQTLGLVARAVPDEQLLSTCRELATQIADGPTTAFSVANRIVDEVADGLSFADSLDAEAQAQGTVWQTVDCKAGRAAFAAKTAPTFIGR